VGQLSKNQHWHYFLKILGQRLYTFRMEHQIHIGTSGWHYKHWIGTYYPADAKDAEQLGYYLKDFATVELNNSFYRLPGKKTFEIWKKAVPAGFVFAVKASRFITHNKKLKDPETTLPRFFEQVKGLGKKLGPVLFQLPPSWKLNEERLAGFLAALPKKIRYVFEFRNHTWYTDEVYALLRKYNCAFCIYELEHHQSPVVETADFIYVRLHGPGDKYQGSYSKSALKQRAKQCKEWARTKDVFVYFDNDQKGYAAFNALQLLEILGLDH
jgi:uncharacterized protein YecE (DUF72 family)